MPRIAFTQNLQRHLVCPAEAAGGATVRDVLDSVFSGNERIRGYVLDDQGAVRKHVTIFVNGQPIRDRKTLSDSVRAADEVFVMQALSGG